MFFHKEVIRSNQCFLKIYVTMVHSEDILGDVSCEATGMGLIFKNY